MSEIKIEKRIISKSNVKRKLPDGRIKIYPQHKLTIPKEFVKEHGSEVYLISDSVGLFVPDEDTLMKVLEKFPELRKFVLKTRKQKKKKIEKGEIKNCV